LSSITDVITPDDIRILIETEDEYARRGNFQRILPSPNSKNYMKYFETPRYHNILLSKWTEKYQENSIEGLEIYSTNKLKLF
jgi:tubulin polyglutamylase TTLL4